MSPDLFRSVIAEAANLGVSVIVVAGGEPLLRKEEILSLAQSFPQILFPLFTNGLMIDNSTAQEIAKQKNIVPLISFEGFRHDTDSRRGSGIYDCLLSSCSVLKKNGIFFGCSVTVTRANLDRVTDEEFIRGMIAVGVRVFTFVEYVPIEPGTEDLVLTHDQQKTLHARMSELEKQFPALFIGFPGDEEQFGGCLAAGRGFIHISSSGNVEPCPAAPFSDANLTSVSHREALQSTFLDKIRPE
jgi:MoaA/NifB/PqqE/SkfB family radical SAM enzyme